MAHKTLWSWNRVDGDGDPGFDEVVFTETDGYTLVDAPEGGVTVNRHLFTCSVEPSTTRDINDELREGRTPPLELRDQPSRHL